MIKFSRKPRFDKTIKFLQKVEKFDARPLLERYGQLGVRALSNATPVDTGDASRSWSYKIKGNPDRYKLVWTNSEVAGTAPLVLLLQYGHGTKSGYFLSGRDFINPALLPIYDAFHDELLEEVFQ